MSMPNEGFRAISSAGGEARRGGVRAVMRRKSPANLIPARFI